ncbi:MAG: hypothetical protein U1F10_05120 [Burkholderiales bacterium]
MSGREKTIYSVYKKMREKHYTFAQASTALLAASCSSRRPRWLQACACTSFGASRSSAAWRVHAASSANGWLLFIGYANGFTNAGRRQQIRTPGHATAGAGARARSAAAWRAGFRRRGDPALVNIRLDQTDMTC